MSVTLETVFAFSASFDDPAGNLIAHNFKLRVLTRALPLSEEKALRSRIEDNLIKQIASRDLGRDVDFLRDKPLTELRVLSEIKTRLADLIAPETVCALTLERGDESRLTWSADGR